MSTRCMIAIENNTTNKAVKKYAGIYCHSDGYISFVGMILHCFYSDEQLVRSLLGLGALSAIGPVLGKRIDMRKSFVDTDYYSRVVGQCRAYYRDAGQEFEVIETNDRNVFLSESYFYLFRNGEWYYRGGDAKRLSKVSVALRNDKEACDAELQNYIYDFCDNDHKRIFIAKLKELGICKIKPTKLYDYTILGKLPNGEYRIKCNINNSRTELDKEGIRGLIEEGSTVDTVNANKEYV